MEMANIEKLISEDIDELLKVIKALKGKIKIIRKWIHSKFDIVPEEINDVLTSCEDLCSIRLLNNIQFSLVEEGTIGPENASSSPISDFSNPRIVSRENTFKNSRSPSHIKEEAFEDVVKDEYPADVIEDIDPLGGLSPSYAANIENDSNHIDSIECSNNAYAKELLPQNLKTLVIVLHDINKSKKTLNEFPIVNVLPATLKKGFHCHHEGCEKSFSNRRSLGSHLKHHNESKTFRCHHEGCGTSLSTRSSFAQHMRKYHPDYYNRVHHDKLYTKKENNLKDKYKKMNKCGKCRNRFSTPEELNDHISRPCHRKRREPQYVSKTVNTGNCDGSDDRIVDTEMDMEKSENNANVCPKCKTACPTGEFLNEHIFNYCYKCKVCRKPFALKSERDEHLCSGKRNSYIKKVRVIKSLSCELCQTNYELEKDFEEHMNEHKVKVISCAHKNGCHRRFTTQEEVEEHEKRIHCQSCCRHFPHLANFTVHNDKNHSGQATISVLEQLPEGTTQRSKSKKNCQTDEYQCSKCSGLFTTIYKLKCHLENGCHECKTCGKTWPSAIALKSHIRSIHTKERPFLCNSCGKTFPRSWELKVHTRSQHVTERKTLKCLTCDKSFFSFVGYSNHMKKHDGVQRELCTFCGFDFANKDNLNRHINAIHKNHRPFPCNLCEKRFKTKLAFDYHVKTHQNPNGRKRGLNKDVDDLAAAAKRRNIKK